jgi:hypothetical protein
MSSAEPVLATYNHPTHGLICWQRVPEDVTHWPSPEDLRRTVELAEQLAELVRLLPKKIAVMDPDVFTVKLGIFTVISQLISLLNPHYCSLDKAPPPSWGFKGWSALVRVYYEKVHLGFKGVVHHFEYQPAYERRPGFMDTKNRGRPADSLIRLLEDPARRLKEILPPVGLPDASAEKLVNITSLKGVWEKVFPSYKTLKRLLRNTKKVRTKSETRRFLVHREEFLRWVDDVKALQRKTGDKAADVSDEALDAASAEVRRMEEEKEKIDKENLDRKRAQA